MKLLTRDTDYAFRALKHIASKGGSVVSASELVQEEGIPRPFLRKILQRLNREGILRSAKGKGGGFCLARPPRRIFLTDLIKIFQGSLNLTGCFLKKKVCPMTHRCKLRRELLAVERLVIDRLGRVSLDLFD